MTIGELNNKWWYRLVKVVYFSAILVFSIFVTFLTYSENKPEYVSDYTVQCNYGSRETFVARRDKGIYISDFDLRDGLASLPTAKNYEIRNACKMTDEETFAKLEADFLGVGDETKLFDISKTQIKVGSDWKAIGFSALAFSITLVVFEVIKRVFYYVVLGQFRPKE